MKEAGKHFLFQLSCTSKITAKPPARAGSARAARAAAPSPGVPPSMKPSQICSDSYYILAIFKEEGRDGELTVEAVSVKWDFPKFRNRQEDGLPEMCVFTHADEQPISAKLVCQHGPSWARLQRKLRKWCSERGRLQKIFEFLGIFYLYNSSFLLT